MVLRWAELYEKMYQSDDHAIPDENSMNIGKLSHGGDINLDTCNAARKTRRLLIDAVEQVALAMSTYNEEVLEVDCWGHLWHVWLGVMTK